MEKTGIEWTDSTWNPVSGCYNKCEYCYAKSMIKRFCPNKPHRTEEKPVWVLNEKIRAHLPDGKVDPYPFGFEPTFHRYRLEDYKEKTGRIIFVGSMTDMFAPWIPDEWIQEVLETCYAAKQHAYLFLTKYADRYYDLAKKRILLPRENIWLGYSMPKPLVGASVPSRYFNTFVSMEPLHAPFPKTPAQIASVKGLTNKYETEGTIAVQQFSPDWIITGAETGNRKGKIIPEESWIRGMYDYCRDSGTPLFMKESIREIAGGMFMQEMPRELEKYRRESK